MDEIIKKVFKHWQGGNYKILAIGKDAKNPNRDMIVYRSLSNNQIWVRGREDFFSDVLDDKGKIVPRFQKVDK